MTPEEMRDYALTLSNKSTLAIQAIDEKRIEDAKALVRQIKATGLTLLEEAEAQR